MFCPINCHPKGGKLGFVLRRPWCESSITIPCEGCGTFFGVFLVWHILGCIMYILGFRPKLMIFCGQTVCWFRSVSKVVWDQLLFCFLDFFLEFNTLTWMTLFINLKSSNQFLKIACLMLLYLFIKKEMLHHAFSEK